MSGIRLQKILSSAGICSRRKAEIYISDGLVSVNGKVVKSLGSKADPEIDKIFVNKCQLFLPKKTIYIVLNKPIGYVSSCKQFGAKTVTSLINISYRIFPVGRLDKNSSGLLLLTNDGRIHHRLSHPSFGHEKEYCVETINPISREFISKMSRGIIIDSKPTRPAKVFRLSSFKFKIILKEGRNRQIRRMVRKLGNKVITLKRIRVENIKLGSLSEGKWRYILQKEREKLMSILRLT